jgi:hypothetical protein
MPRRSRPGAQRPEGSVLASWPQWRRSRRKRLGQTARYSMHRRCPRYHPHNDILTNRSTRVQRRHCVARQTSIDAMLRPRNRQSDCQSRVNCTRWTKRRAEPCGVDTGTLGCRRCTGAGRRRRWAIYAAAKINRLVTDDGGASAGRQSAADSAQAGSSLSTSIPMAASDQSASTRETVQRCACALIHTWISPDAHGSLRGGRRLPMRRGRARTCVGLYSVEAH